jgi:hypothetical protein
MGNSYVRYQQYGFWANDRDILSNRMSTHSAIEPWQNIMMNRWRLQSEIDGGCVHPDPDHFLADDSRQHLVLSLASEPASNGSESTRRTAELLVALLSGKLQTNASSPVDSY